MGLTIVGDDDASRGPRGLSLDRAQAHQYAGVGKGRADRFERVAFGSKSRDVGRVSACLAIAPTWWVLGDELHTQLLLGCDRS